MERNTPFINPEFIESLVLQSLQSDAFLPINKTLIQHFGLIGAAIICNYIDKYKYFKQNNPEHNGWFFLTHEMQMEQLNIGEYSIMKIKNELKNLCIIQTKTRGIPPKEWILINFERLAFYLSKDNLTFKTINPPKSKRLGFEIKTINPPKSKRYNNNIYNKNKLNKNKKNISLSPLKKHNEEFLPLAQKLSMIIQSNKNYKHTLVQIKSWTNDFRRLQDENGITIQRMQTALDWYKKNIGGEYIPVIESGNSFRMKFEKLEAAISRQKNNLYNTSNGSKESDELPTKFKNR
jgi:hypothetical protein